MSLLNQLPFDFSLDHSINFEDFVVDDNNVQIFSLLNSSSKLESCFYYLWGSPGTGKSHLLQAFCDKADNAVYVPLKKFAVQGAGILEGLENMDIICLDDIECILDEPLCEERFFEFFNTLMELKKTLIVSASSSPRNIKIQLADLASRLSLAVVFQLHELSDTDKAEALKRRVTSRGIPLNKEVLDYILLRSARDMTALFNVLAKLDQLSLAEKRRITIPFVRDSIFSPSE